MDNAQALDGKKIFMEGGAQPGAMPCVACHGADGSGMAAAGFPGWRACQRPMYASSWKISKAVAAATR
jgi:cytochrome c553